MLILERNSLQICPAFFQTRYLEGEVESVQIKKLGGGEHHKDVKSRWDYGLVAPYSLATWIVALRDRDNLFNRASLTRYRFCDHFQTDRWAHEAP